MADFRLALADRVQAPLCGDCAGVRVAVEAWTLMPAAELRLWLQRHEAAIARTRTLGPGDAIGGPLLCRCAGNTLRAAIDRLDGGGS